MFGQLGESTFYKSGLELQGKLTVNHSLPVNTVNTVNMCHHFSETAVEFMRSNA